MPGAAASGVMAVLAGPTREARLLGAFPSAVYLELPALRDGAERPVTPPVIALLTPDAVRLPKAVVIAPTTAE
ncbi:MAG: hypothetical protein ACRDPT_11375, partial [Streptomycetales bacterium]